MQGAPTRISVLQHLPQVFGILSSWSLIFSFHLRWKVMEKPPITTRTSLATRTINCTKYLNSKGVQPEASHEESLQRASGLYPIKGVAQGHLSINSCLLWLTEITSVTAHSWCQNSVPRPRRVDTSKEKQKVWRWSTRARWHVVVVV